MESWGQPALILGYRAMLDTRDTHHWEFPPNPPFSLGTVIRPVTWDRANPSTIHSPYYNNKPWY